MMVAKQGVSTGCPRGAGYALAVLGLGFWALVGVARGAAPEATQETIGWHGEVMPSGMVKGEVSGDYLWPADDSVMVYVPAGTFAMGSDDGAKDEGPVHEVELSAYYIDKYEVSWRQWKRSGLPYVETLGNRLKVPEAPDWGIVDEQPVVNVSWYDARAYVAWAGKRLPSEAQWEKAARGRDGRTYPWGNEPPDFSKAVWRDHPIAKESTAPVDCCAAGASPYGALNMAGNVYEWCDDVYDKNFYAHSPSKDPRLEGEGRFRVLRGGAFLLEIEDLRSAYRYRLLPVDRTPYIGFRGVVPGVPGDTSTHDPDASANDPEIPDSAAAEPTPRKGRGWFGEVMPQGLERGRRSGEYLWTRDGSSMVFVPAGAFTMGSEDGERDEAPMREVTLDAYYIDTYEVSWRQWRRSGLPQVKDLDGRPIPDHKPVWGRADHLPVTYIQFHDAVAYAEWVGKRLPTEAEWEKAARGDDGRTYPWGEAPPTFERAVWKEHPIGREAPAPVDCCPAGASPYGAFNMAGNVFEWCSDFYGRDFYGRAASHGPFNPHDPRGRRVLRGGAFVLDAEDLRVTLRNRQYPEEGQDYVGFRLVLPAPQP